MDDFLPSFVCWTTSPPTPSPSAVTPSSWPTSTPFRHPMEPGIGSPLPGDLPPDAQNSNTMTEEISHPLGISRPRWYRTPSGDDSAYSSASSAGGRTYGWEDGGFGLTEGTEGFGGSHHDVGYSSPVSSTSHDISHVVDADDIDDAFIDFLFDRGMGDGDVARRDDVNGCGEEHVIEPSDLIDQDFREAEGRNEAGVMGTDGTPKDQIKSGSRYL